MARARVLLWARERSNGEDFEVSKVVSHPLQPKCSSAPTCPSESQNPFQPHPVWIDPDEPPPGPCPYDFQLRGQCLLHRNRGALEAALFQASEAARAERLLNALGYEVRHEAVDPLQDASDARILCAHSALDEGDEVRVLPAPGGGRLVLVRARRSAARAEHLTTRFKTT